VSRDPSGWELRILSPVLPKVEFEFMRTTLGPGVDTGGFLPHTRGWREYVAIDQGAPVVDPRPCPTASTLATGFTIPAIVSKPLPIPMGPSYANSTWSWMSRAILTQCNIGLSPQNRK